MSKWKMVRLGEVLDYEQPTKYIVESTDYNDCYCTPVLTAGQTFILGYTDESDNVFKDNLPVIIFDDFTTAIKYVNFPFKVKSSAMKILKAKKEIAHIKYLFYCMSIIKVDTQLHKRYWISKYTNIEIPLPPIEEQKRIADILDKASSLIDLRKQQLEKMDLLIKSKFIDMFGDPVNNPKGWEVKKIQDVSPAISSGKRVKEGKVWLLNLDAIEANSGRVLRMDYVKLCDLSNSTLAFDLENVLYSKLRPYLNKVVLPKNEGFATTELVPLRPNKEYLTREFLTYLLRCESFVRYISEKVAGAKMPRVSMSDLRGFPLILPPLPLQDQFAAFVEQVEKQKEVMQQSLEKMETNYKALMQEFFG